jgi:hypothetical protein
MKTILLLLMCATGWASTITADTTCTVNNTPTTCTGLTGSPGASAGGGTSGIDTTEIFTNISAWVWTPFQSSITSATAQVSTDFLGSTDGLERQGLATYFVYTDGDSGGGGGAFPSASIEGLGECHGYICHTQGSLVPFTLGVPFEVTASIHASASSISWVEGAGGAVAQIRLQLFELDGAPVTISAVPVPEPVYGGIVGLILGLLSLRMVRK